MVWGHVRGYKRQHVGRNAASHHLAHSQYARPAVNTLRLIRPPGCRYSQLSICPPTVDMPARLSIHPPCCQYASPPVNTPALSALQSIHPPPVDTPVPLSLLWAVHNCRWTVGIGCRCGLACVRGSRGAHWVLTWHGCQLVVVETLTSSHLAGSPTSWVSPCYFLCHL